MTLQSGRWQAGVGLAVGLAASVLMAWNSRLALAMAGVGLAFWAVPFLWDRQKLWLLFLVVLPFDTVSFLSPTMALAVKAALVGVLFLGLIMGDMELGGRFTPWGLAFLVMASFSAMFSSSPVAAMEGWVGWALTLVTYWVCHSMLSGVRAVERVVKVLLAASVMVIAYGLLQVRFGYNLLGETTSMVDSFPGLQTSWGWRISSVTNSPNALSAYLNGVLAIVLALAVFLPRSRWRNWLWALAGLCELTNLLTLSKGGMVATGCICAVLFLLSGSHRRTNWARVTAVGMVLLGLVIGVSSISSLGSQVERFVAAKVLRINVYDPLSTGSRLPIWTQAVKTIGERPLTGVGSRAWRSYLQDKGVKSLGYGNGLPSMAHNQLLTAGVEFGVVGMVAYVAFVWVVVRHAWSLLKASPHGSLVHALAAGCLLFTVGRVGHDLFDSGSMLGGSSLSLAFWVILAIQSALERHITHPPSRHHRQQEGVVG